MVEHITKWPSLQMVLLLSPECHLAISILLCYHSRANTLSDPAGQSTSNLHGLPERPEALLPPLVPPISRSADDTPPLF